MKHSYAPAPMALAATAGGDMAVAERASRWRLLAWSAIAVALFAALAFWSDPQRLTTSLGDTDDATRIMQARALLAGSWYDMTLARFGGPYPLVSHWSRLVDVPIAGLLWGFERVLAPAQAELVVRALWPLLLLMMFVYMLANVAQTAGGRRAGLLSIALTVTCIIGIVAFLPGRIDHHNAMIVCTVIGILQLARSFDYPRAGWSAGVLLGLALAIGYEALALTAASLGGAILYALLPGRSLAGPARATAALAATLAVALAVTTPPSALAVTHCDALSLNLVALAACGALGVATVHALERRLPTLGKLALLAAGGAIGLALYAAAEPACLRGPFGQVDPALIPVWLANVSETQSILSLGSKLPTLGGMALAYFAAGTYAGFRLMQTDRSEGLRYFMLVLIIAIPLGFWQVKLLPYATFLTVMPLSVWLARPPQATDTSAGRGSLAAPAAGALIAIAVGSWLIFTLGRPSVDRVKAQIKPVRDCQSTAAITPLAGLPKGLFVADVNLGPYVVALTRLDALSAPYHRMSKPILEAHHILNASPAEAERRMRTVGATYVIVCPSLDSTTPQEPTPPDALKTLLVGGTPPAFLERVPLPAATPLSVWRLKD